MLRRYRLLESATGSELVLDSLNLRELPVARGLSVVDAQGHEVTGMACPSQPGVQEQWINACAGAAVPRLELNGLGFWGNGHFFQSICFCAACQYGYGATGGILQQIALENWTTEQPIAHPSINLMLMWRRSVQYGLLQQIGAATEALLCLRTAAELRYAGDRSSLTFEEARAVVAACSVKPDGEADQQRLEKLPRSLPVYRCVQSVDQAGGGFDGYVECS